MLLIPFDIISFAVGLEAAKAERQRFDSLTTEQKMLELRIREVNALERQADALKERNRIERGKFF